MFRQLTSPLSHGAPAANQSKTAHFYKTKVFFDLKTTGSDTTSCEIIQLSAVCGSRVFNAYTVPLGILTERAREVTGFTVCNGKLFCHGIQISTVCLYDLLNSFIDFLHSFPGPILLVAHSAKIFDAPVLTSALRRCFLQTKFQAVVTGYLDTFFLSKNVYPGLRSYSKPNLVRHYLGKTYNVHNALEDAMMLQELFNAWNPGQQAISRFIYRTTHICF